LILFVLFYISGSRDTIVNAQRELRARRTVLFTRTLDLRASEIIRFQERLNRSSSEAQSNA